MSNNSNKHSQFTNKSTTSRTNTFTDYIIDPVTRRPVKLLGTNGREILRNYLIQYGRYLDGLSSRK